MTGAVHNCVVFSKTPETSGQPITNSPPAYYPASSVLWGSVGSYCTSTYLSMHAAQLSIIGFMVHSRQNKKPAPVQNYHRELLEYPYQFPAMWGKGYDGMDCISHGPRKILCVRILRITVDSGRALNSKRWICDSFHDRGLGCLPLNLVSVLRNADVGGECMAFARFIRQNALKNAENCLLLITRNIYYDKRFSGFSVAILGNRSIFLGILTRWKEAVLPAADAGLLCSYQLKIRSQDKPEIG
jgi:hypothetical protein